MQNGEVFSNKSAIFLNPSSRSSNEVGFCDIPLNKDKFIERTYISVKENDLFSTKQINQVDFYNYITFTNYFISNSFNSFY